MPAKSKIKIGSYSIPPPKRKRGRKRTKKRYFTEDTDAAIKEYLASSNQKERDHIFATRIHYAFYKLAENLIHTFKFYYTEVDNLEDLKHEVICFLLEKLEDFITKQSDAINKCNQRLKEIDYKNVFYADDEIGWFFQEVKKIQEALNEFTLK